MKTTIATLSLALLLPFTATAGPPQEQTRLHSQPRTLEEVQAGRPRAIVTVDCENAQWPSLQEVADYQGLSAFDPVAHVRKLAPTLPGEALVLVNLSGRGDKDAPTVRELLAHDPASH